MVIITDAASAGDLFEKYSIGNSPTITVVAGSSDTFAPDAVQKLLAYKAEILTIPEGASKAFAIGVAVDKKWTNVNAIYVISKDTEITKSAKLMGFQTELPQRGQSTKRKTKAAKTHTSSKQAEAKIPTKDPADKPKEDSETPVKRTRRKPKADDTASAARKPRPAKDTTETPKKKPPKPETVYADNSDAAGSKPTAAFTKAIVKAGVNKQDAQGVWNAVVKSSASIVYDMQLRLCLLDSAKAGDIYDKTGDVFDDLKALTGGANG